MTGEPQPTEQAQPCLPCRGSGLVISGLGGSPSQVTCPWCDGSGLFVPGHDAQEGHHPSA